MKASRERGGSNGGGAPPTDLLVCFPSRAHLTLMPKAICSPSRAIHNSSDNTSKRSHHPRTRSRTRPPHLFQTQTTTNRNRRANSKTQLSSDMVSDEPTSPKVTCAGQIKVRHKNQNLRHAPAKNWVESLGLKKDVMNFLGALRSLRFNMACFGSFPGAVDCCSDEDEDNEEEEEQVGGGSQNVFSQWFMLLEENEAKCKKETDQYEEEEEEEEAEAEAEAEEVVVPPKNALLLMRCRSAPAKGWLEAGEDVEEEEKETEEGGTEERLMLMSYAPDFFKLSTDIAKETWVVGSVDPLARSRSWKR